MLYNNKTNTKASLTKGTTQAKGPCFTTQATNTRANGHSVKNKVKACTNGLMVIIMMDTGKRI